MINRIIFIQNIHLIDISKAITLQTFEEFTLNMPKNLVTRKLF